MRSHAALAAALAASLPLTHAHSWIESAYKYNPSTLSFFGSPGYPRGGNFRRLSAETGLTDTEYVYRIPANGAYTGQETINERPIEANRPDETLEAAPGDHIAIMHLENGHVSYPQPGRPLNQGNVYIYGTSQPRDHDRLADIHLVWNAEGTGGDGRGRLLATRNYDDGQCYEGNAGSKVATTRSAALPGSDAATSMPCQSNIQLPDDLEPGSNYTVYWYWDWPLLNTDAIDMDGTKKGQYPWMGTFVQGEKDPRGFTASQIAANESYASTLDIKIVDAKAYASQSLPADETALDAVYRKALKGQEDTPFIVQVPTIAQAGGSGQSTPAPSSSAAASSTAPQASPMTTPTPDGAVAAETVTVTATVTATPAAAEAAAAATTQPCPHEQATTTSTSMSIETVTEVETQYATVYVDETETQAPTPTAAPMLHRRRDWAVGGRE